MIDSTFELCNELADESQGAGTPVLLMLYLDASATEPMIDTQ